MKDGKGRWKMVKDSGGGRLALDCRESMWVSAGSLRAIAENQERASAGNTANKRWRNKLQWRRATGDGKASGNCDDCGYSGYGYGN